MMFSRAAVAVIVSSVAVFAIGLATAGPAHRSPRSADLFLQMMPVLQSPRCMNCHTKTDFPRQGDDRHRHIMLVMRGADGHGSSSLRCSTCHRAVNSPNSGVPGAPDWHLAPLDMAWEGLSAGALCRLLRDPHRGSLKPDTIVAHMQTPIVQWAWSPGADLDGRQRQPPPVSSTRFVELTKAWVASGAACPL